MYKIRSESRGRDQEIGVPKRITCKNRGWLKEEKPGILVSDGVSGCQNSCQTSLILRMGKVKGKRWHQREK